MFFGALESLARGEKGCSFETMKAYGKEKYEASMKFLKDVEKAPLSGYEFPFKPGNKKYTLYEKGKTIVREEGNK